MVEIIKTPTIVYTTSCMAARSSSCQPDTCSRRRKRRIVLEYELRSDQSVHTLTQLILAAILTAASAHQFLQVLCLLLVVVQLPKGGGTVLVNPETHVGALLGNPRVECEGI